VKRAAKKRRPRLGIEPARQALLGGDRARALMALDELLAQHPDDAAAHGLRGDALMSLGREPDPAAPVAGRDAYMRALADYERVIDLVPDLAAGYLGLARALVALDRLDPADRVYEQVVQLDRGSVEARLERGVLYLAQGMYAAAVGDFESALVLGEKGAAVHAGLGDAWLGLDDYDAAINHYSLALRADPAHAAALLGRTIARVNLGHQCREARDLDEMQGCYEQGVVDGQRAVELDARNPLAHGHLARALQGVGAYDRAVERFEGACALAPDDPALLATLRAEQGITLHRWGELPGAAERREVALARLAEAVDSSEEPTQVAWIQESRGAVLRDLGRPDEALVAFDQAIAADDLYGWALVGKGGTLLVQSRYKEAAAVFERLHTVDLGRRVYRPWAEVGLLLAHAAGEPSASGRVALMSTASVRDHLDRADIFEALGYGRFAEQDRATAVTLAPDRPEPLCALAWSLLRRPAGSKQDAGRPHRALEHAERALATAGRGRGRRLACLHVLGMAQFKVGRSDEAIQTLQEAVRIQPLDLRLQLALDQARAAGK
jgi:tetratricopeptide (TPR) repeat protein